MPTIHDDLIKELSALMDRIGKKSSPELIATEMLRMVGEDIDQHPDLWPASTEDKMAEANLLISEHFS